MTNSAKFWRVMGALEAQSQPDLTRARGYSVGEALKKAELPQVDGSSAKFPLVELMRKTVNSSRLASQRSSEIHLDTCVVQASNNWFVLIGTYKKS
ncbi:MAG: hypothetical protein Q4B77_06410 [Coriobacteriaceae bacterium]|nr:hypothetical protein [Coriobacteriaceae bacterium]